MSREEKAIREAVEAFVNAHPQVVAWNFGPGLKGIADGKPPEDWYEASSE